MSQGGSRLIVYSGEEAVVIIQVVNQKVSWPTKQPGQMLVYYVSSATSPDFHPCSGSRKTHNFINQKAMAGHGMACVPGLLLCSVGKIW
jgi:hypothetical protein